MAMQLLSAEQLNWAVHILSVSLHVQQHCHADLERFPLVLEPSVSLQSSELAKLQQALQALAGNEQGAAGSEEVAVPDWGGNAEAAQPPPAPSFGPPKSRRKGSGNTQPRVQGFEPLHARSSHPQGSCRPARQSDTFSGLQQQSLEGSHGRGPSEQSSGQDPVGQPHLVPVQFPRTAGLGLQPGRCAPAHNLPAAVEAAQTPLLQPARPQGQARHISAVPRQQRPAAPPHTSSEGGALQRHLAAASQRQNAPAIAQHVTSRYTVEEPDSPTAPPGRHTPQGVEGWTVPLDSPIAGCLLQETTGATLMWRWHAPENCCKPPPWGHKMPACSSASC